MRWWTPLVELYVLSFHPLHKPCSGSYRPGLPGLLFHCCFSSSLTSLQSNRPCCSPNTPGLLLPQDLGPCSLWKHDLSLEIIYCLFVSHLLDCKHQGQDFCPPPSVLFIILAPGLQTVLGTLGIFICRMYFWQTFLQSC